VNSILLIAVLGQWSWDDAVRDHKPAPPAPPVVKPAPPPSPPVAPAPKVWTPIYRLDSRGVSCTGYLGYERELDAFIRGRETMYAEQAKAQAYVPIQTYGGMPLMFASGSCANGSCN
jgi:hypothetical protein